LDNYHTNVVSVFSLFSELIDMTTAQSCLLLGRESVLQFQLSDHGHLGNYIMQSDK